MYIIRHCECQIFNLAKQGYCIQFVCDRLCVCMCVSVCVYVPGGGGGGGGGGVRPEKKYRGVRELLFIPKKGGGGLENWNKHRSKAVVGEGAGGGVPLTQGGSGGPYPDFLFI